jgi:hypothetical protein
LQDLANIGRVRILVVPNGPTYEVQREDNATQFQDVNNRDFSDIYVMVQPDGRWAVKRADGVANSIVDQFDTRNEAEANAMDLINGNNAPVNPAPATNAPASPTDPGSSNPTLIRADEIPQPQNPATPANDLVDLPPDGEVASPDAAPFVRTFFDQEIPRNRYDVVRGPDGTKFIVSSNNNLGAEAFVRVERTANGWRAIDPRPLDAASRVIYDGDDRRVAEMVAINRMTGADFVPETSTPATVSEAPDAPVNEVIAGRNISRRSIGDYQIDFNDVDSGQQVAQIRRLAEAPGGGQVDWYEGVDANGNVIAGSMDMDNAIDQVREFLGNQANVPRNPVEPASAPNNETDSIVSKTIGGKEIIRRGRPNGEQLFIYDMNEVGRVEVAPNGKFLAIDVFNGDQNEHDNLADAIAEVEGRIETYAQGGLLDTPDDGNGPDDGSGGAPVPPSNPPVPPANPVNPTPAPSDNGGVPPVAPSAPAPRAPKPAAEAKRNVNNVKPGDRYTRFKVRNQKNGASQTTTYWDVYDKKTGKVIGSAKTREDAEDMVNGIRDERGRLIDFTNPVAPSGRGNQPVAPEAPAAPSIPDVPTPTSTHQRTDLGSDMFSLHDGNKEYGIAEKGADGKWTARVHLNPRDALNNRDPISSGSYDTAEEAEAAMRKVIADKNAPPAAEMLQWQSGSDGKQYLGLDGVPGIDANNAPYYGISPGPFGGWIVAGWSTKGEKDAGLPPIAVTNHADEESAKEAAKGYAQSVIDSIAPQEPATPPAPTPVAPPAPAPAPAPAPRPAPRRRQQQQWQGETPPWLA